MWRSTKKFVSGYLRQRFVNVFVVALLVFLFVSPFWARAKKPAPGKVTADLPAGPMQAKATTACTECHEARIILQQRLSKTAWTKEVDKMIRWGAVVDSADRDALIDYLSGSFPVDKAEYVAERSRGSVAGARKK